MAILPSRVNQIRLIDSNDEKCIVLVLLNIPPQDFHPDPALCFCDSAWSSFIAKQEVNEIVI